MRRHVCQPWAYRICLGLLIALALISLLSAPLLYLFGPTPPHPALTESAWAQPRKPGMYRFQPKPDITAYELSQIIGIIHKGVDFLPEANADIEGAPPNVKRHFLPPEEK